MPGTFTCQHCGSSFTRPHLNREHRYCSRKCGAQARTGDRNANWRNGMTKHPSYGSWRAMFDRCDRPSHKDYPAYGGRGITVCDRWRRDFWAFVADMGPRPKDMSIDRIDTNGNYERRNCRWATASEQRINQRRMTKAS